MRQQARNDSRGASPTRSNDLESRPVLDPAIAIAGITAGWEEGVEVNVLGLTFGLDPYSLSIKLPLIGRIGPSESQPVTFD